MYNLLVNIITDPLFGIILFFVGYFLGNRLSIDRDRRKEFNDAVDKFRIIFETIKIVLLENVYWNDRQIVDGVLRKNYAEQKIAMDSVYNGLGVFKKRAFSKAWQEYIDPENCGGEPFLSYCGMPWEVGKASYDREYILEAINHLLSLAKFRS